MLLVREQHSAYPHGANAFLYFPYICQVATGDVSPRIILSEYLLNGETYIRPETREAF